MSTVMGTLAVQIEGNLLAPDMTADVMAGSIKGRSPGHSMRCGCRALRYQSTSRIATP